MFGELGLIYNRQRAATCIVLEETVLAYMSKENFSMSFGAINKYADSLKKSFFEDWVIKSAELKHTAATLSLMFERIELPKGRVIVEEGGTLSMLWIIFSGEVILSKSWKGKKNKEHQGFQFRRNPLVNHREDLVVIAKGEMIGEESIFNSDYIYKYRAETKSTCVFYRLNMEKLHSILNETYQLKQFMKARVSARKELTNRLISKFIENVNEKTEIKSSEKRADLFRGYSLKKDRKEQLKSLLGVIEKSSVKRSSSLHSPKKHHPLPLLNADKFLSSVQSSKQLISKKQSTSSLTPDLEYLQQYNLQNKSRIGKSFVGKLSKLNSRVSSTKYNLLKQDVGSLDSPILIRYPSLPKFGLKDLSILGRKVGNRITNTSICVDEKKKKKVVFKRLQSFK